MAELPLQAQEALQKLKEQLTCPVCLEHYKKPKLLQCFHVLCEACIEPLAREKTVECPSCRHLTLLPAQGVQGLQGAFLIHHLFDIHDTLEKVSAPADTKCQKCKKRVAACYCRTCKFICEKCKDIHSEWDDFATHEIISLEQLTSSVLSNNVSPSKKDMPCQSHSDKQLDLFCETCEEMICRDCIVRVHREHRYDLVREAFPKHKDELVASLKPVATQLDDVNIALGSLDKVSGVINERRQALKVEIKASVDEVRQALNQREEDLLSKVDQLTEQELKATGAQKDHLELVATRLKSCYGFVEETIKTGTQEEVLTIKKSAMQQINEIKAKFNPGKFLPDERAKLKFYHEKKEDLLQACKFGEVKTCLVHSKTCSAEGKGLDIALLGERATVTVHLRTKKGETYEEQVDISSELVPKSDLDSIRGEIEQNKDTCIVSYRPPNVGCYSLSIQVEGMNIAGSPFAVSAISTTPTKIITGFKCPWGITVNKEGQLIVSEYQGQCITVVDKNWKKHSFGTHGAVPGKLEDPQYVVTTNCREFLVSNGGSKVIQKYSMQKQVTCVKHIEARGNGAVQPFNPMGIAVHPTNGKIFVADQSNHLIQIYNADFTHSGSFGGKGPDKGKLDDPRGICFDSTGNLFVCDSGNRRIQVFTPKGEYIFHFSKKGVGKAAEAQPYGIAMDANSLVYITQQGYHHITIFNKDGQFLKSFGTKGKEAGKFDSPTDITVDMDGKIYIADANNCRVQVF